MRLMSWAAFKGLLLGVCLASLTLPGGAQQMDTADLPPLRGERVTLPVGSPIQAVLRTPVDTALNQPGDPIEAEVSQDVFLGEDRILSQNDRLLGEVSVVEPPLQGRNAILGIRFTRLQSGHSGELPVQAYVKTSHPHHTWGGELTPGTEYQVVTHRVMQIGAYNQAVLRGPRAMGSHVQLAPGERMTLILEAPVTLERAVLGL